MNHIPVGKLLVYQRLQTLKAPQPLDPFSTQCCLGSPSCRVEGDAGPKYHEGVGVSCHEVSRIGRQEHLRLKPLYLGVTVSWFRGTISFQHPSTNLFFFLPGVKREKDRDLVMWAVGCLPGDVKNCRVDVGNLGVTLCIL